MSLLVDELAGNHRKQHSGSGNSGKNLKKKWPLNTGPEAISPKQVVGSQFIQ